MITKIRVNGFKSLEDFEVSLHPGLNILVGPNGRGKDEYCPVLRLSVAPDARGTLPEAVSCAGRCWFGLSEDR